MSFTFVRNPWSRLVSTYRQKVARGATTARLRDGIYEGFLEKNIRVHPDMSFAEFCELACSFPDELTDKHLQSQSYTLMHKGSPVVSVVGRFETMGDDWRSIMDLCGLSAQLPRLNASTGERAHYRDYYKGSRLVNLVGDRYAADIDNFGYTF